MFGNDVPAGAGPVAFVHKRLIGAVGGFVTGGPGGAVKGFFQGGGGVRDHRQPPVFTGLDPGAGLGRGFAAGCQPGFVFRNGRCERSGFGGFVERALPGGRTGTQADIAGGTVEGGFNMPAFVPAVVGNISRLDGSSGPILRCPRGTVLATDDLCYAKGTKGLTAFRKWKPTPPGFLPRRDVVCLRRAVAIRGNKTNRKLFRQLGLG